MHRQQFPVFGLSLENGTENVPDDGRFYLLVHGESIGVYTSLKAGQQAYDEERRRLIEETGWTPEEPPPDRKEMLRRMRAHADANAVASAARRSKQSKATRKGGKGGSGGV